MPSSRPYFTNRKEEALNFSLAPNASIMLEIASSDSTEATYQSFIAAYH
jgi:hypothetical protein